MDKDRFQPSLLRGLYRTESVPVSWDEVYRLITEDETVKQQTELYRSTHDEKYKHALPAVTTAVQLDGKGKAMENIVGYTGVTHCDLDHVPTEQLGEVLEKIKSDPHTFLCNVSPSGCGVHIYGLTPALPNREGAYHEAFMAMNCYYADLLGLPFDEQCSNPNKTLSLSHDPDAYFNPNAEVFKVNANYQKIDREFFLRFAMKASQSAERIEKLSIPFQENNFTENLRTIDGNSCSYKEKHHGRYVKNYLDPIEFAEEYVRNRRGLTYAEGCRNAYLYECLNMMNLLGVPRTDAESWLRGFDLPEREKMSVLKSAYKRTADFGKFDAPYTWKEEPYTPKQGKRSDFRPSLSLSPSHTHACGDAADEEAEMKEKAERQRRSTQMAYHPYKDFPLPKFIQQIVDCGESKAQRDVMRLSAFTVLGAMLGKLVSFNYDKHPWYPSLQVFVIAPPASGKSCVNFVRHLAEPLHDELLAQYDSQKKKYEKDKAVYDMAGKGRANMEIPVPPAMKMFLISGNNSATGILENLADADGNALICESEADTLSAAINSDYGHWDVIVRRAHDHDRLSYNRRTNKEYREIKEPCMGVLICGTPAQVKPLIPSAENGLFSRQIFATLPSINGFLDKFGDSGINLNRVFRDWGKELHAVLSAIRAECSGFVFQLTDSQRTTFIERFNVIMGKAEVTRLDDHMKSSVARLAVNLLRMMAVVAFFRSIERLNFQEIHEHPKDVQITRLLLGCPGLEPGETVPAENLRDGICSNYIVRITDEDLQGMLDMAEPLYDTAADVLTLLPWTEAERIPLTPIEQVLGSMPLRFSRQQALEKALQLGVSEDQLDGKLRRMRKNMEIRQVETGIYEFAGNVTSA